MSEHDYPSNSFMSKESQNEVTPKTEKKVEKVATGKIKKKGEMQKLASTFISEDAANVKNYIWMDVLVPTIKKAIFDVITNSIDMVLYGGNGRLNKRTTNVDRVSYRNYSNDYRNENERRNNISRTNSVYSYGDVVVNTRKEGEDVLARMDEALEKYGMVSVGDLYDLVDVTCNYTDYKYGWTDLREADVVRVNDGYLIKLPKVKPLS